MTDPTIGRDRRAASRLRPRIEVVCLCDQDDEWQGHTVVIVNVSDGGLLVRSSQAFVPGELHEFRFTAVDSNRTYLFQARVVHCLQSLRDGQDHIYIVGLKFLPPGTHLQRQAIQYLRELCAPPTRPGSEPHTAS